MAHRFIDAAYFKSHWGADQVDRLAAAGPAGPTGTESTIDGAIDGAEAEVLALILPRYRKDGIDQLPATPETTPRALKDLVADVAIYHLARPAARVSQTVQSSYERAIRFAGQIGRGVADIGLTNSPAVDASTPQLLASKTARQQVFGNGGLDEW